MLAQKNAKGKKVYKVHWTDDGKVTVCDMPIAHYWRTWEGELREYYESDPGFHCSLCHDTIGRRQPEYKKEIDEVMRESRRKSNVVPRADSLRPAMPEISFRAEKPPRRMT